MKTTHLFGGAVKFLAAAIIAASSTLFAAADNNSSETKPVNAESINPNRLPGIVRAEISEATARAGENPHPRLFADAAGFEKLKRRATKDPCLKLAAKHLRYCADLLLDEPPLERELYGKRLLKTSRAALYRINTLALAYRLYGKSEHLARAVAELRAVCAFVDWNPSHFLDVAEMSLAVATGYDWLYPFLSESERTEISAALRKNGLTPGYRADWWITAGNNWGQVCHAGMLAAALALAEENPAETARFVQRCVDCIPISMKVLAPDGNFPEGPAYWSYGIEFNVAAINLLEGTLGSDFGLTDKPGFKETAQYIDLVTAPGGTFFNYADCTFAKTRTQSYPIWWFAKRLNRPDLLVCNELEALRRYCTKREVDDRMFAYSLFSIETPRAKTKPNLPLVWSAGGSTPIAIQRSSWNDPDAFFVGLKGGTPSTNHGHMDIGSFVLEANGVRWALDLGMENYTKIEAQGISLWDMHEKSSRWKIFRLGTSSHNELMLDGRQQAVNGFGKIVEVKKSAPSSVMLDLTSVYTNAKKVTRQGIMSADGRSYEIVDTVEGLRPGAPIRWSMITAAAAEINGNEIILRQEGKTLRMKQTGKLTAEWKNAPATGPNPWDSPNDGCSQLTFTVIMPQEGAAQLAVNFSAEGA